jgi:hypothetical protein
LSAISWRALLHSSSGYKRCARDATSLSVFLVDATIMSCLEVEEFSSGSFSATQLLDSRIDGKVFPHSERRPGRGCLTFLDNTVPPSTRLQVLDISQSCFRSLASAQASPFGCISRRRYTLVGGLCAMERPTRQR